MKNPNTSSSWDKLIKRNSNELHSSPIFLDKNDQVLKIMKNVKGRVLDVGFGYGYLEKRINESNYPVQIFGLDISRFAVEEAKKNLDGKFLVGNVSKIPFNSEYFDCVLVLDVLEHISPGSISKALSEVYRVLKRGGLLVVSVPLNEGAQDKRNNLHLRKYSLSVLADELSKFKFQIRRYQYLFAYKNFYRMKSIISKMFKLGKPNLLIIEAHK